MKKRRILAWALSLSMLFTSFTSIPTVAQEDEASETAQVDEISDTSEDLTALEVEDDSGESDSLSQTDEIVSDSAVNADSISPLGFEGFKYGYTLTDGNAGKYDFADNGDSVRLSVNTSGAGKISGSEDGFTYYASEVPDGKAFTISGTLHLNAVNYLSGESNPHQTGFGMMLLDDLYQNGSATQELNKKVTPSLYLTYLLANKNDTSASFVLRERTSATGSTAVVKPKNFGTIERSASDVGPYQFRLSKTGDNVAVSLTDPNGETYTQGISLSAEDINIKDTVYPGFFVARDADITLSNVKIDVFEGDNAIKDLAVTKQPDRTKFYLTEDLDLSGMEVTATYGDGSKKVLDDFDVSGHDPNTVGNQALTIFKDGATTTLNIEVSKLEVVSAEFTTKPFTVDYYNGSHFSPKGLELVAKFGYGDPVTFTASDAVADEEAGTPQKIKFSIDGKEVTADTVFMDGFSTGDKDVVVEVLPTVDYDSSVSLSYPVKLHSESLTGIFVATKPESTYYFVGDTVTLDDLIADGLVVKLGYSDGRSEMALLSDYTMKCVASDGTTVQDVIDTSKAGTYNLVFTSTLDSSISASYEVTVSDVNQVGLTIDAYPKTTYDIGESWNPDGLDISIISSNESKVDAVLGTDYTIDASKFNSSAAGTYEITINPTNSAFSAKTFNVTVRQQADPVWKSLVFGQSATGVNEGDPSSYVNDSGDKVRISSWHGSGKITGDHDGIAYYYTRVNPADNFSLSATVHVIGYLGAHPGNGAKGAYNIDEKHTGQESFGLMARDVIPLVKEGTAVQRSNGQYTGDLTVFSSEAEKDDKGEPVGRNAGDVFASNIAIAGGYSGSAYPTDKTSASYEKNAQLDRINLYARTGVTAPDGGGTKYGPQAISTDYPHADIHWDAADTAMTGSDEKADQERIAQGDTYRITLERVNVLKDQSTGAITRRGLKATCTVLECEDESRIGETMETFMADEIMNNLFEIQNSEDAYVGLFAARWGIIDASDIEFSVSDPATDYVYNVALDDPVIPTLTVKSDLYTTNSNYTLIIQANNDNGGFLTIKKGDDIIYHQMKIGKKRVRLPLTLDENSANVYTAVYTPSKADNLSSYEDVVKTFTVYHRYASSDDVIYVSPDGLSNAQGTRDDPMDFRTSIGFINPGQTIVMLDGTYKLDERLDIDLGNDGYAGNVKSLVADAGATPVIDFQGEGAGFYVAGNYWYLKGFEVIGSSDNQPGFELGGKNCTVEDVKTHDNGGTGFQVSRVSSEQEYFKDWPSNNIILNCETWNNADSTKINADGFGCKLTVGNGNVFDGCLSHHNCDDGWDLYTKLASGAIGETVITNSATYLNGYRIMPDGTQKLWGGGGHNGFKMGGENIYDFHYIKDSFSYANEKSGSGVSSNSNPALKVRNTVFYKNESSGVSLYSSKPQEYNYDLQGVISFENGGRDAVGGSLNRDTGLSTANHADFLDTSSSNRSDWVKKDDANTVAGSAKNYFMRNSGEGSVNGNGEALDPSEMFVSTDFEASTDTFRFTRNADGSPDYKGFLQRKVPYVHESEDEIVEVGCFGGSDNNVDESTTAATTEITTQSTTKASSSSSSSSSSKSSSSKSGGSSSKSSKSSSTTKKTSTPGLIQNANGETDVNKTVDNATKNDTSDNSTTDNNSTTNSNTAAGGSNKFNDIGNRTWAAAAIDTLTNAGIISGVGDGQFAPDSKAKRADFVVAIVKILGLEGESKSNFDDVDESAYYANAVGLAKELGIVEGLGDNKFNPNESISRQDIMVLVGKALETAGVELNTDPSSLVKFADNNQIADYAKPYVAALVDLGIVSGTGENVEPVASITRAQMAVLLNNVYNKVKK